MTIQETSFVPSWKRLRQPLGADSSDFDGPFRDRVLRRFWDEPAPRVVSKHTLVSTADVLSEVEFDCYLERERHLADRGGRRFSLMVLELPEGDPAELDRLARQLYGRLRSTDLIGRLDDERLGVLLTDTSLAGANVVAAWVDRAVAALEIQVERAIFVYPAVDGDSASDGGDDTPRPNWTANRGNNRRGDGGSSTNGHAKTRASGTTAVNGRSARPVSPAPVPVERGEGKRNGRVRENAPSKATHARKNGRRARTTSGAAFRASGAIRSIAARSLARWPLKDLWAELSIPMPLWKRSMDVVVSSLLLIALFPLFVCVAIAIKLDSPGPVIFKQQRAGRGARPFAFYKFRSMSVDAEARRAELAAQNEQAGPVFKIRDDPRVTRVGRFLRRFSIDELPQIWNVLKGDISLVGPRSPTLDEVAKYDRWQMRRLNVTGGITCFWQVSGRNNIDFEDWVRLDMRYIAEQSFWLDLRLLAMTLPAVLTGRGAY